MLQETIETDIEEKTNESIETIGKTTENEDDEIKVHTELAIKHLRVTPATRVEQQEELLQFIARKERRILELKEELARQEEELNLLKEQWETITLEENDIENKASSDIDDMFSLGDDIGRGRRAIAFGLGNGVGNGFKGIFGGSAETERGRETLSNIRSVVIEVKDSERFKQTRQKTYDLTAKAWGNLSKGISNLAHSEALRNARRKTYETVHTFNDKLASPTTRPTTNATNSAAAASLRKISEHSISKTLPDVTHEDDYKEDDYKEGETKYSIVVAESPIDDPNSSIGQEFIIGED
ncbi:728_t:CDS:2 [Paraglomus occultum]|uniref:728_t:CDS:1 n=1 Tax=Paraglomus occultum TaxID=144539 RepID=A0A9N9A3I2_9GLOM|nr:728_t:CDS:2 [Paraglomus occultum]